MRVKISFLQKNGIMKPYEYEFQKPHDDSIESLAFAIANAKHLSEHKTKFTGVPDSYELILGMLKGTNIQFSGTSAGKADYFDIASQRNDLERLKQKGDKIIKTKWRVGVTFSNRLVIDIDNHDEMNCKRIIWFYSRLLEESFYKVKTNHGYWLILRKKYESIEDWKYDNCMILMPSLQRCDMGRYLQDIGQLDYTNKIFKPVSSLAFSRTSYFQGVGNFDIAFTRLSLKRERSTLRISKKSKDDNIEVIQ